MFESGKLIISSFPSLLLKAWEEWDVRGMVLFSLTLQIILSVLGKRRKYTISLFTKTILWFAYLSADWIAIATLGKLSGCYVVSPAATNVLRAYWAPLLLLHLGGADTITAYAFEDNSLWIRHLLILVVKAILVFYVICLSWTPSWLSFLNLPLTLAGITKYVERILCLKLNNSQKTKPIISIFNPDHDLEPNGNPTPDCLLQKNADVIRGYLLFTVMRPDVNDYLSHNLSSAKIRIHTYLKETTTTDGSSALNFINKYFDTGPQLFGFKIAAVELGFIFDVVYTKAALIYSKSGCLLHLTSFACSFSVMLIFLISIMNQLRFLFPREDIYITGILMGGAIVLELYAAWVMLSSDWAIVVATFHHNVLVRKMVWSILKCFPWLLRRSKRWSEQMGQFDLLKYCLHYKRKEENKLCGILGKINIIGNDFFEMWHKYMFTDFVTVPCNLKLVETYKSIYLSFFLDNISFEASRGKRALHQWNLESKLEWSIILDFDYSIIIWHLATTVCYNQDRQVADNNDMTCSKCISDYMMYLLAMRPSLLLPEHSKSFWLDHTYDKLKELIVSPATDEAAAWASFLRPDTNDHLCELESSETTMENLLKDASKLATYLNQLETSLSQPETSSNESEASVNQPETSSNQPKDKWEMIKEVWIEMLLYAAFSTQHISHVKQLAEGAEFLSLVWLGGCVGVVDKIFE